MTSYLDSELRVDRILQIRPALTADHLNRIDLDLMHLLNVLGLRLPHPTEPADCTVLEVVSGDTTSEEALDELRRLVAAVGEGHTFTGAINGVTGGFSPWRLTVRDGAAVIEDGAVIYERDAVVIERGTLEEWAGRPLTGDEVIRIAETAHLSDMPDVIGVLAARINGAEALTSPYPLASEMSLADIETALVTLAELRNNRDAELSGRQEEVADTLAGLWADDESDDESDDDN